MHVCAILILVYRVTVFIYTCSLGQALSCGFKIDHLVSFLDNPTGSTVFHNHLLFYSLIYRTLAAMVGVQVQWPRFIVEVGGIVRSWSQTFGVEKFDVSVWMGRYVKSSGCHFQTIPSTRFSGQIVRHILGKQHHHYQLLSFHEVSYLPDVSGLRCWCSLFIRYFVVSRKKKLWIFM